MEGKRSGDIQLIQNNISLIEGKEYVLSFEAWAESPRLIDTRIEKAKDPWRDYGKYGLTYITNTKEEFEYKFTMTRKTDTRARFVVNVGGDNNTVHLKNIKLKEL